MDVLILCYRDEPLREFPVQARPLEVGRGAFCDIVVHDPKARERHLLVQRRQGTVMVQELGTRGWRPLPANEPLPVGGRHTIVRVPDAPTRPRRVRELGTEPLRPHAMGAPKVSLVVGRGHEARRVPLEGHPVFVGTDRDNDLVLADRTVSGRHCRIEPSEDGLRIRDLGSRNGTCVNGVPVTLARVEPGAVIRLGRTDLRLVPRSNPDERLVRGLVADSARMRELLAKVDRLGPLRSFHVLITGESGSGKEGIARALHDASGAAADGPFVAVNAGGMPATLVESELFGHEKGAFTGASHARRGVFEQAHGGTLFLDEIGELPLELQARLLRVLETWQIRRLGGERPIGVDVRLVCATHRNLRQMVEEGTFRQDLYYRIAQVLVEVPPLRDRPDDVEGLATLFLRDVGEQVGPRRLTRSALIRLKAHDWPGNVRELKNVILNLAFDCAAAWISAADVERALGNGPVRHTRELEQLELLLEEHRGNMAAAARALGVPRTTFRDRLRTARRRALRRQAS